MHEDLCHGRWSVKSQVPYNHYLSRGGERDLTGGKSSQGAVFLGSGCGGGVGFTLEGVKAIAVARGVMGSTGEESNDQPH